MAISSTYFLFSETLVIFLPSLASLITYAVSSLGILISNGIPLCITDCAKKILKASLWNDSFYSYIFLILTILLFLGSISLYYPSNKRGISMTKNQKALIRQTTIFNRLNTGKVLNVKHLAEEFGVSVRTIQKDFNERLNKMYDIVDKGHGNYAFARGYHFNGTDDEDEKIAVSLMKGLQQSAIPQMDDYVNSALLISRDFEKMFIFGLNFEPIKDIEEFKIILKAIRWRVGLEFNYTRLDGKTIKVLADPYRIANFNNYWYLLAYDPTSEQIKSYYLGNISKLKTLYENFTADPSLEKELNKMCNTIDSVWFKTEKQKVTLKVTSRSRYYLMRYLPTNIVLLKEDEDAVLLHFSYYHETELFDFLKHWLPDVKIMDNDILYDKFTAILQNYFTA